MRAVQTFQQVARRNARIGTVKGKRSLRVVALADRCTAADQAEPEADAVRVVVPGKRSHVLERCVEFKQGNKGGVSDSCSRLLHR